MHFCTSLLLIETKLEALERDCCYICSYITFHGMKTTAKFAQRRNVTVQMQKLRSMLAGKRVATQRNKCIRKTTSTFRGKRETNRGLFTSRHLFSQFSRKRAHDGIILKMRSYSAFGIVRPDKI